MKRISTVIAAASLITIFWSGVALAWGSATHAYIADRIGRSGMFVNSQEMYGSMAPDVFNFSFSRPEWMAYLYRKTHTDFMGIWEKSRTPAAKALGYGFASHNVSWGADLTAHVDGITTGKGLGYVTDKAIRLAETPELAALGLPAPVLLGVCHSMVEYAVDILVRRLDPQIGRKVVAAALLRSPEFPALLNHHYAGDLTKTFGISKKEAADFIIGTESNFRHITLQYGTDLTDDEAAIVQTFAGQLSTFAGSFLQMYGVNLPEGVDLQPLAGYGIQQGMQLCVDDFAAELAETVTFTRDQLEKNGIRD